MQRVNAVSRLIGLSVASVTCLSAVPLMQLIISENDKLMSKVEAWNKECGRKPYYDQDCMNRRYNLCGELGKFVALANDEIGALSNLSPDTSASDKGEFEARRKSVEHLIDVAVQNIKCLGRSDDPHCEVGSMAGMTESTRGKKKIADVSNIRWVSSIVRSGVAHITIRNNNPYPIRGIQLTVNYYRFLKKGQSPNPRALPEYTQTAFLEDLIMPGQEYEFDQYDADAPSRLVPHNHGMPDEWIAKATFEYAERVDAMVN